MTHRAIRSPPFTDMVEDVVVDEIPANPDSNESALLGA